MNQEGNIRKYTTFCGGINEDCQRKSKKNNKMYLLTNYIKSVLWGAAIRLSYIQDAWCLKVNQCTHQTTLR